jgi:hypothetical protein
MKTDLEKFQDKLLSLIIAAIQSCDHMRGSEQRQKLIRRHMRLEKELIRMYKKRGGMGNTSVGLS